ncbi:hypothetical protein [Nonomuraea gerenzanensis]|uniref:Uncharacterized protein n=1 Tax=Nonomuraea gerenzanensis TaxID=93944 RepID=A0A1M4ELY7_9ACTN|nr:hypothetical protein [Nonomuraea gerenzanensis]UBU11357.1 hypothetical protein LCN96_44745 [Nonomuraea gerenzanensis]SBO99835.1 hypothetical protein BN4615_P9351 [Nonomuraea gerenzanensis]
MSTNTEAPAVVETRLVHDLHRLWPMIAGVAPDVAARFDVLSEEHDRRHLEHDGSAEG